MILRIQESRCREKTLLASKVTRKEDRICPFYHVPFFASLDSVKGYILSIIHFFISFVNFHVKIDL